MKKIEIINELKDNISKEKEKIEVLEEQIRKYIHEAREKRKEIDK